SVPTIDDACLDPRTRGTGIPWQAGFALSLLLGALGGPAASLRRASVGPRPRPANTGRARSGPRAQLVAREGPERSRMGHVAGDGVDRSDAPQRGAFEHEIQRRRTV